MQVKDTKLSSMQELVLKKNNYREYHKDSHYLFARNKQRREFISLVGPEACILSMDDMAKLKVGAPAVSRYHQIKRLFASSDMPNLNDHDFPVPNYLLSVSGYMFLEQSQESDDIVHESDLPTYDICKSAEVGSKGVTIIDEAANSFWEVLIKQLLMQSNLVVTEEELKDIVRNAVNAEDAKRIFENLTDIESLKSASEALSSFFRCEFIKVSRLNRNLEIFNGQYDCTVKQPPIYYGFDDVSKNFHHVSFRRESNKTYSNIAGLNGKQLRHDALGRLHLNTPYTGNAYLKIRSHKYNSTTAATHVTDLYNILSPLKSNKSVYLFLADGGPDFNPSHIANDLYYYRLFKKLDADILGVMTYAARYSAFNPIEHCWSPLSDKLSGVTFSPLENEDDASAPALQSGLSKDELKEKEKVVFDRAMKSLTEISNLMNFPSTLNLYWLEKMSCYSTITIG